MESCRVLNKYSEGQKKPIIPKSLYEICIHLGLRNTTYASKILSIPKVFKDKKREALDKKISKKELRKKNEKDMKSWIFKRLKKTVKSLQKECEDQGMIESCAILEIFESRLFRTGEAEEKIEFIQENKTLLADTLKTLFEGVNKDIYHPEKGLMSSFFPEEIKGEVEKIHTWEKTDTLTIEALKKNNWNEFWILSQSGAWFFRGENWEALKERVLSLEKSKKITIRIVATEFTPLEDNAGAEYEEILKKELKSKKLSKKEKQKLKENLNVVYEQIPYWEHHHMFSGTVSIDEEGKCGLQYGLHGSREQNQDFISPMFISRKNQDSGVEISHKTENYLKYLEYLFKVYFLASKRKKIDEKEKGTKSRPRVDYFLDSYGSNEEVRSRIDEEWDWAVNQK